MSPLTYEAVLGGPLRRRSWRRRVRKAWVQVAERCGLASSREADGRLTVARLLGVQTSENAITLRVRAAVGQTVDDLDRAVEAIATAFGAESAESRRVGPGVVEMVLTMRELLHQPTRPPFPEELEAEAVTLGRRSDGSPWRLELNGRHTLVVGRSGAGKGSIFWGVAGNLAPAAHAGLVRLWGIDLKGGVEVAVGAGMFSSVAMDEQAALGLLRSLHEVIVERQGVMRGRSRQHEASPGDPAHVLLIDELAVLTAYASRDVVNEASGLLKRILTQGRALGVMVVAFVQDPRKETIGMRELFTQTTDSAIVWQWHAPELWRRFTIALRRQLATELGLRDSGLNRHARLEYAKVAEFQARGLVHFHVLVRIDGPDGPGSPAPITARSLEQAVRQAASTVSCTAPPVQDGDVERILRFGAQTHVRIVRDGSAAGDRITTEQVAAYLAKYAPKAREYAKWRAEQRRTPATTRSTSHESDEPGELR